MVMNKKAIYGVVQDVDKPTYYTGLETDTATVNVDNERREISVDVHLSDFTGTAEGQAYPGPLGALLATNLQSEVQRSTEEDEQLQAEITDLQRKDNELSNQIVQVAMRVPTKVTDLSDHANYVTSDSAEETFASKEWVTAKINEAMFEEEDDDLDLSIYALKTEVAEDLQELRNELIELIPGQLDLSDYAKLEDVYTRDVLDGKFKAVNDKIDTLDITSKLSNYYTKLQTDEAINHALNNINLISCGSAAELLQQLHT